MSAALIHLLRQRLSDSDARDIADDFGVQAGLGPNLYDRLSNGGTDARVAAVVKRAQQLNKRDLLVACITRWRPDLATDVFSAIARDPQPVVPPTRPPGWVIVVFGVVVLLGVSAVIAFTSQINQTRTDAPAAASIAVPTPPARPTNTATPKRPVPPTITPVAQNAAAPVLQSPLNGQKVHSQYVITSVVLQWSPVPAAVAYKVEIFLATDPQGTQSVLMGQETATQTQYEYATVMSDNYIFYWQVTARYADGNDGPPSEMWQFITSR